MVHMIFTSLLLFGFVFIVDGNHFLGGTITWQPLNASATGTPVAIVITQTYLWTYSLITCTYAMIANNQFVPTYSGLLTDTLNCIVNCGVSSGGYLTLNVIPRCTDISAVIGITTGQRTDTVYLQAGDDFSVAYQKLYWRPLTNASLAPWSISVRINVNPRSDNGLYNNAPVATAMSPMNIPVNQPTVIKVPIGDADGDPLRCRWANKSNGVDECGGVCPPGSLPPSTVIYPNCTIIITGQTVGDWFAVALMVEDFINSSSLSPLSSTPVQFLVQVVAPPACIEPPEIVGEPVADSCMLAHVGQNFVFQLIAINNCGPSVTIDDIATLSFPGMVQSNLVKMSSTTYYKNLTWIPTVAQIGYQVMCAMAVDSQESQSAQYCFKFYVSNGNLCFCPGGGSCTTTTTSTTTTSTSSATSSSSTTDTTTTATSTTSTTSTSISSLTASSTTPTDSTWILVGALAGAPLLFLFILGSCLCWYYCSPCGIGRLQLSDCQGPFEFYHIDSNSQSKFRSFNALDTDTMNIQSIQRKDNRVYDMFNTSWNSFTTQSLLSNDSDRKKNVWLDDEYTTKSFENKYSFKEQSNKFPEKKRTARMKPNRVTIFSCSPKISPSMYLDSSFNVRQMNQTP